jgi:transcriptional regulator with XRE-family HTH domain
VKTEEKTKNFSHRLIGARNDAGLTQAELADAIGVSLRSIQNWEDSRSDSDSQPGAKNLRKLAEVLGCSIPHLLGTEESTGIKTEGTIQMDRFHEMGGGGRPSTQACRDYLEKIMAHAKGKPDRIGWILEQLRDAFPVDSPRFMRWRKEDNSTPPHE